MKNLSNQLRVVQYKQYLQAYFEDGTILAWQAQFITYYSLKGNKINIPINQLQKTPQISRKVQRLIGIINQFNDDYIEPFVIYQNNDRIMHRKYKIKHFSWQKSVVKQTSKGYEIISDDFNACILLRHDLFMVDVDFLQLTSKKKTSMEQTYLNSKNKRKQLLQKYSYKYNEFKLMDQKHIQFQYQYHKVKKQFTIFNLPQRWYPPIKLIWSYILSNQLINHPFCYIDFDDKQNQEINRLSNSQMPSCLSMHHLSQNQQHQQPLPFPLFGKPNHQYPSRWIYTILQQHPMIFHIGEQGQNILCESFGFWFFEDANVIYKTKNKDQIDYQVSLIAFPFTVRIKNQPHRNIKQLMICCKNYLRHKQILKENVKHHQKANVLTKDQEAFIEQQFLQDIGLFKAYGNRFVLCKFHDKTIITLHHEEINIIDLNGKSFKYSTQSRQWQQQWKWHMKYVLNFYQKIYEPQAYEQRMLLNDMVEIRTKNSQILSKLSQHINKKQSL